MIVVTASRSSMINLGDRQLAPAQLRFGDDAIGGVGNGAPPFVSTRPTGGAPARIDLDQFHVCRYDDSIARDAAQITIHRRDDAVTVDETNHIILEHVRADVERRAPNASSG